MDVLLLYSSRMDYSDNDVIKEASYVCVHRRFMVCYKLLQQITFCFLGRLQRHRLFHGLMTLPKGMGGWENYPFLLSWSREVGPSLVGPSFGNHDYAGDIISNTICESTNTCMRNSSTPLIGISINYQFVPFKVS